MKLIVFLVLILLILVLLVVVADEITNEYNCKCHCTGKDKCSCNCIGLDQYDRCNANFGNASFLHHDQLPTRPPPILIALPGSASNYVRLLVEYATGIVTGSIELGHDPYLKSLFKGESACGIRTSLVKGTPSDLMLIPTEKELYAPKGSNKPKQLMHFQLKETRKKCNRGMIHYFDRLIFLSRDPYDAVYTNIQLEEINKLNDEGKQLYYNSYIEGIYDSLYPENFWENVASYNITYRDIIEPSVASFDSDRIINIRYEDLLNDETMIPELKRLISFLGYTVSDDRLRCSFILASKFKKTQFSKKILDSTTIPNHAVPSLCKMQNELFLYQQYFNYTTPPELKCTELSWQIRYKDMIKELEQQENATATETTRI
jgi:hypothetical protein